MTRDALKEVLKYVEEQGLPVQLTFNGKDEWVADFPSRPHSQALYESLKDDGFSVTTDGAYRIA